MPTPKIDVSFNLDGASQGLIDAVSSLAQVVTTVVQAAIKQSATTMAGNAPATGGGFGGGAAPVGGGMAGAAPAASAAGSIQYSQPAAASTSGAAPGATSVGAPPAIPSGANPAMADPFGVFRPYKPSTYQAPHQSSHGDLGRMQFDYTEPGLGVPGWDRAKKSWDSLNNRNEGGRRGAAQAASYVSRGAGMASSLLSANPAPEAPFIQGLGGIAQQWGINNGNKMVSGIGAGVQAAAAIDQMTTGAMVSAGNQYMGLERPYARLERVGMGTSGLGGSARSLLGEKQYVDTGFGTADRAYKTAEFMSSIGGKHSAADFRALGENNPMALENQGISPGTAAFFMSGSTAGGGSSAGWDGTNKALTSVQDIGGNMGLSGNKVTELLSRIASSQEGMAARGLKIDPGASAGLAASLGAANLVGAGGDVNKATGYGVQAFTGVDTFLATTAEATKSTRINLGGLANARSIQYGHEWGKKNGMPGWLGMQLGREHLATHPDEAFKALVEPDMPWNKGGSMEKVVATMVATGMSASPTSAFHTIKGMTAAHEKDPNNYMQSDEAKKLLQHEAGPKADLSLTTAAAEQEEKTVELLGEFNGELRQAIENMGKGRRRGIWAGGALTSSKAAGDSGPDLNDDGTAGGALDRWIK